MKTEFRAYIRAEKELILRKKWEEGIRLQRDPGDTFVRSWIRENAESFRQSWFRYNCGTCPLKMNCPTDFQGCIRKDRNG
ncbi:MAG: hypothetical protein ACQEQV_07580 [Fibrobacterota bacterium]